MAMPYTTLISPAVLSPHIEDPDWAIFDCRFSLTDTEKGLRDFIQGHIPGAQYAHLDRDLSGPVIPGKTGRHPLPAIEDLVDTFSRWGIHATTQVVTYDDMGGAIAARFWWLLRWLGHENVAVLNGGWQRWVKEEFEINKEVVDRTPRLFNPSINSDLVCETSEVVQLVTAGEGCLLDARARERYDGLREPIDPIAGHIPTALSVPFAENLDETGLFKSPKELLERFQSGAPGKNLAESCNYCGSGITATHNLLALAHAGYPQARLYPGSWSEWITDPANPIAQN